MAQPAPRIDDVAFDTLLADPYPTFDRIRPMGSAVWVEAARIKLVTRFDDIMFVERNHATFSSTNPASLMNEVMGVCLMRKDDEPHQIERKAMEPAFAARTVKEQWNPAFEALADRLISEFEADGRADLFNAFAAPMASLGLLEVLGFKDDVPWQDLCHWSQSLMDGVGNYSRDPEITALGQAANKAIAVEIDRVKEAHGTEQNLSLVSSILHAEHPHSLDQLRANINVTIGGGLNEPRDAILTLTMALLQNPDQLAEVRANPKLWMTAFEEAVRWVSPIGMYPRLVTEDTVLGDTELEAGEQIGLCVGAANRDPSRFEAPEVFDIHRPRQGHLGFGAGPHFCAGTWVARQMVGAIAVPMLFDRLRNLRLDPDAEIEERGWVFRGPTRLPVVWDPA
ncbi:cytochrome P450 [Pseudaestuariivita sp.]|uniref:cytochrome P450 n=1 Tax=Pseudaestuariivita sp. TaxID=2211669 RepID=UPI004059E8B5